ncbi:Gfo/Idh/MocA family protein [Candidatus Neomarinimicrobiota bacterium]
MIQTGIIGFGKMGRLRAAAIQAHAEGEIAAIHEIGPGIDTQGIPIVDSAEAIIEDPNIEAIFICTPNYLNKPLTIKGLQAGKHVFCEKPPAFNADEMKEVRQAEEASDRKLMYGFNHRHHESIRRMREIIQSGEFGDILWIRGRYGKSVDETFFKDWRSKRKLAGGGILLDQGIHMLDLFLYLHGPFDEVKSFVSNLYWKTDIEDNVFAIFRDSRTGVAAQLHSTMTQWRHLFSLEIFLAQGHIVLNGLKTSSGTYGDEQLSVSKNRSSAPAAIWENEERIVYHTDRSWDSEIAHFFEAIKHNKPIEIGNSQDALELMQMIDRIYEDG